VDGPLVAGVGSGVAGRRFLVGLHPNAQSGQRARGVASDRVGGAAQHVRDLGVGQVLVEPQRERRPLFGRQCPELTSQGAAFGVQVGVVTGASA
jgi:hypothetical protein